VPLQSFVPAAPLSGFHTTNCPLDPPVPRPIEGQNYKKIIATSAPAQSPRSLRLISAQCPRVRLGLQDHPNPERSLRTVAALRK